MSKHDDQELERNKTISGDNRGIDYRPDIDYEPEDIPLFKYIDGEPVISDSFRRATTEKSNIRNTHAKIDFLIAKAEEKLSKYEGFEDFKSAVIKKMYCQQPITREEQISIEDFKQKLNTLETLSEDPDYDIEDRVSEAKPPSVTEAIEEARKKAQGKIDLDNL